MPLLQIASIIHTPRTAALLTWKDDSHLGSPQSATTFFNHSAMTRSV